MGGSEDTPTAATILDLALHCCLNDELHPWTVQIFSASGRAGTSEIAVSFKAIMRGIE